jgi:hypothetical protein
MDYIVRCVQREALSMTLDILVKNVALWGAEGLCDLGIANGRFVSVNPIDCRRD